MSSADSTPHRRDSHPGKRGADGVVHHRYESPNQLATLLATAFAPRDAPPIVPARRRRRRRRLAATAGSSASPSSSSSSVSGGGARASAPTFESSRGLPWLLLAAREACTHVKIGRIAPCVHEYVRIARDDARRIDLAHGRVVQIEPFGWVVERARVARIVAATERAVMVDDGREVIQRVDADVSVRLFVFIRRRHNTLRKVGAIDGEDDLIAELIAPSPYRGAP